MFRLEHILNCHVPDRHISEGVIGYFWPPLCTSGTYDTSTPRCLAGESGDEGGPSKRRRPAHNEPDGIQRVQRPCRDDHERHRRARRPQEDGVAHGAVPGGVPVRRYRKARPHEEGRKPQCHMGHGVCGFHGRTPRPTTGDARPSRPRCGLTIALPIADIRRGKVVAHLVRGRRTRVHERVQHQKCVLA